jgi:hypothetical protein
MKQEAKQGNSIETEGRGRRDETEDRKRSKERKGATKRNAHKEREA